MIIESLIIPILFDTADIRRKNSDNAGQMVDEMIHEKPKLLLTVKERKLKYSGHLIRGNGKQRVLLEKMVEWTRKKEKTKEYMGYRYFEMD